MKTMCDTHILLFWANDPGRLTAKARQALKTGVEEGSLSCADITWWEIALLHERGRLRLPPNVTPSAICTDWSRPSGSRGFPSPRTSRLFPVLNPSSVKTPPTVLSPQRPSSIVRLSLPRMRNCGRCPDCAPSGEQFLCDIEIRPKVKSPPTPERARPPGPTSKPAAICPTSH